MGDGDFAAQFHSTRRAQWPGGGRHGMRDHSARSHARRHTAARTPAGRARHAVVTDPPELERELRWSRREGPRRDPGLLWRRKPLRVQTPVGSHRRPRRLAGRGAVAGDARVRVERDPRRRRGRISRAGPCPGHGDADLRAALGRAQMWGAGRRRAGRRRLVSIWARWHNGRAAQV